MKTAVQSDRATTDAPKCAKEHPMLTLPVRVGKTPVQWVPGLETKKQGACHAIQTSAEDQSTGTT